MFTNNIPKEIVFDEPLLSFDFHPKKDLLSVAGASGNTYLYEYSEDENKCLYEFDHHLKSCRDTIFSEDGQYLYTSSVDKSIVCIDLENQKNVFTFEKAHDAAINRIKYAENYLVSGDDNGVIKIWDLRKPDHKAMTINAAKDYITDFDFNLEHHYMYATSGDNYLTVIDFRKGKQVAQSEDQEDEFLCVSSLKAGRKIVCGTQSGVLAIFSFGEWLDRSDHYPGHPDTVDSIFPIDDDAVITGCGDGVLRIVGIFPNKILGVVGEHPGDFPIRSLRKTYDNKFLGSIADNSLRFWNIEMFYKEDEEDEEESDDNEEGDGNSPIEFEVISGDEVQDENEEESEENFDSSESQEEEETNTKKRKRPPTQAEEFFSDL